MLDQFLLKCIIIEDEPLAQKQIETFLQEYPFIKLIYTLEDVDQLTEHHGDLLMTDILFLDINIKGGDIKPIKFVLSKVPYIIITSVIGKKELSNYLDISNVYFLRKPFSSAQFKNCIENIISGIKNS